MKISAPNEVEAKPFIYLKVLPSGFMVVDVKLVWVPDVMSMRADEAMCWQRPTIVWLDSLPHIPIKNGF